MFECAIRYINYTENNQILGDQCVQLYYFEQLYIHLPKTKINKLVKIKQEQINQLINQYYDENTSRQQQNYDKAIKTKVLLLNLDLYLNYKNFTKLPRWRKKFEYQDFRFWISIDHCDQEKNFMFLCL